MRAEGNGTKVSAHGLGAPGTEAVLSLVPVLGLGPGTEDMAVDGRVWALGPAGPREAGAGGGQGLGRSKEWSRDWAMVTVGAGARDQAEDGRGNPG